MSEPQIGQWVKREGAFRRHRLDPEKWVGPRWHLVESLVAAAAVTRCGNTMQPKDARNRELQVSDVMPLTRMIGQPQNCRLCDREPIAMVLSPMTFEDDASTQPELVP